MCRNNEFKQKYYIIDNQGNVPKQNLDKDEAEKWLKLLESENTKKVFSIELELPF